MGKRKKELKSPFEGDSFTHFSQNFVIESPSNGLVQIFFILAE
jgi:hypothetical protein